MVHSRHIRCELVGLGLLVGITLGIPLHASSGYCNPDVFPFTSGGQIGVDASFPNVYAVTEWNGDLSAAGSFATAGGQTVNHIARWDGSALHRFTSGGQIGVAGGSFVFLTV